MKLGIVLLAGGEGRRIGGDKPLRMLGGETLAARVLAAARGWSDEIRVAVRGGGLAAAFGVAALEDDPAIEGPLAGIASALRDAAARDLDSVLTLPCDTPFLPADLPDRLSAAIEGKLAALASSAGHLHPTCALWASGALAALPAYLATGRRSIRSFAEQVGHSVAEWGTEPFDPFFNINDAADLAKAEAWLRSR
ncbi:MAG: mobA [Alphaproteobacteria bacterium]|nr:mobA [Alphaproteobacteria bacterium]